MGAPSGSAGQWGALGGISVSVAVVIFVGLCLWAVDQPVFSQTIVSHSTASQTYTSTNYLYTRRNLKLTSSVSPLLCRCQDVLLQCSGITEHTKGQLHLPCGSFLPTCPLCNVLGIGYSLCSRPHAIQAAVLKLPASTTSS